MSFFPVGIQHWLLLCLALFSFGLYGLLTRRSAMGLLLAIEIMVNSAAVLVVALIHLLHPGKLDGQLSALFFIALAAAEVVLALGIYVPLARSRPSGDVTQLNDLRG